jgi:predicted nucleic acid-binding protein
MKRVVADASFCAAWILPDESSAEAFELLEQLERGETELVLPSLWYYEMGNLLKSAVRRKRISKATARAAQALLGKVPVSICDVPTGETMKTSFDLAMAHDLSIYDSSYLELAKRFQLSLKTNDTVLESAAKKECGNS